LAGLAEVRVVADDLFNVLVWAPEHRMTTTPRWLAIRLAVTPAEVLGALELLQVIGQVTSSPALEGIPAESDEALDLADRPLEILGAPNPR